MTLTLDLPETMMRWLQSEADASGKDPAAFVGEHLAEARARAEAQITLNEPFHSLEENNRQVHDKLSTASRADTIADAGRQIYETEIKHLVEPEHTGEFLVIDINSRDYAFAPTEESALEQIETRQPQGIFYLLRIGYVASLFIGAAHR